ncbi:Hypothetical protein GLP15_1070 [Giardia lamblia P15]|uniref:U3 small nucleolar RNA-associated protein 6 N-terminal domain-containing protein n=1 Tax=Giardia intestinalis (strain P15) TaxID=658858 RepID=E1F2M8_GIAIA|nr:Hypothetical protein GLP15_1070 [Giardia lamblia P15]
MASRQTQFALEKMVPEFTAYKRSKVFQPDELVKLVRRRKEFEEKLNADLPPLRLFLQYIMHLHSTYKLVVDRWVKLGNSKEELFEEARSVYARASGVVDLAIRRYRGNPEAWQALLELLGRIKMLDKQATVAQLYLQTFPSDAEPWILAAHIAEETEGITHARSIYQQAVKSIGLLSGVTLNGRYHGSGRSGIANTETNKRIVEVAIRRKLDSVRASTDPQLMLSPWKRYSLLVINWACFEVRHIAALRGKYNEQNYLSDYIIDKQFDGSPHMQKVLQGELVAIVLRRGIIAALSINRLPSIPDNVEFDLLSAYEQGKMPYLDHPTEYRAVCYASVNSILSSPVAEAFLKDAYEVLEPICVQNKWVSWWTGRVLNWALQKTATALQKAIETKELSILKRYQVETKAVHQSAFDWLGNPGNDDYGDDPLRNVADSISLEDLQRLQERISTMIPDLTET